jgi:hypothetical protein
MIQTKRRIWWVYNKIIIYSRVQKQACIKFQEKIRIQKLYILSQTKYTKFWEDKKIEIKKEGTVLCSSQ